VAELFFAFGHDFGHAVGHDFGRSLDHAEKFRKTFKTVSRFCLRYQKLF
jgi:hypothetical protein